MRSRSPKEIIHSSDDSASIGMELFQPKELQPTETFLLMGSTGKEKNRSAFRCSLLYTIFDKRRCGLLGGLFVIFLIIEAVMIFATVTLLWMQELPSKLVMQHYEPLRYRELNEHIPSSELKGVTIYHVTKEYDAAAMGGLGQIVTGLSHAQANAGLNVNIVMPHYRYLNSKYKKRLEEWSNGEITYNGWRGQSIPLPYSVHRVRLNVTDTRISFPKQFVSKQMLTIYLIGPSTTYPFDRAFQVDDIIDIYSSPPGLPQEWKDLYFCKAAADFIAYQSAALDTPLFQSAEAGDHAVDLVHLHGATNALTVEFMDIIEKNGGFSRGAPTIVYTLHDYLDELEYSNELKNINRFMDTEDIERLADKYLYGHRVYTSALGIDSSHVTTFVSRLMAKQMVEGQLDFRYKELVMPSLRTKAGNGYFVGITNGVDLSNFNPFADHIMAVNKVLYPNNIITAKTIGTIPESKRVITAKKAAKKFLIKQNLLSDADLDRPLVLFVGRFQGNKGIDFFPAAAHILRKLNAKLILMGQHNNGRARSIITTIKLKHPDHVTVIDDNEHQTTYGKIYRAAADIVFVPSLTESFGLVAVEGLLFGCPVVTSGVGGMKEFLVDKMGPSSNNTNYNSYVFNLSDEDVEGAVDGMKKALETAIQDYRTLKKNSNAHESFVRSLIKDAMKLGWHVKDGAERQYAQAYYLAIKATRKEQFRDASFDPSNRMEVNSL